MKRLDMTYDELVEYIEELERDKAYLKDELYSLENNLDDIEESEYSYQALNTAVYNLYLSKITLAPALFEQEIKSFFINMINKRI